MEDQLKLFVENQKDFLKFLKAKFHLYHLSNVFFRDIHYGVMAYLDLNSVKYRYTKAEELTWKIIESLEKANILKEVDHQAWVLLYPEFKKPPVKPAVATKPAAPVKATAPAPKPAVSAAKPATSSVAQKETTESPKLD
jgi:hypothetical protein